MSWRLHRPAVRLRLLASTPIHAIVWMVALVVAGHCWASESRLTQQATFHIAKQSLDTALIEFSKQAGVPVSVAATSLDRMQAPALSGTMEAGAALRKLLNKSGLRYEEFGDTVTIMGETSGPANAAINGAGTNQTPSPSEASPSQLIPKDQVTVAESSGLYAQSTAREKHLEEIVVTARKRTENIQDVPVSIAVLTASDIDARGLVNSEDYLRGIPGVNQVETGYNGGQSIIIRGIETSPSAQNYGSGTTFASYFGETPTTNTAGLNGGTSIDLKLVDIERVEVLRGPQGTAFGDSSLGGAVRTIPVAPKLDVLEGQLASGYSNTAGFGGKTYNFQAIGNIPLLTDSLAIRAVAYRYTTSGYYRNVAGSDPAFQAGPVAQYGAQAFTVDKEQVGNTRVWGGRIAALFQPSDNLAFTLNYLYQKNETDGVPIANSGTYEQTFFQIAPQQVIRGQTGGYSDQHIAIVNPLIEYKLDWADLIATYSYTKSGSENAEPYGYLGSNISQSAGSDGDHSEHVGEIRLTTHFNGKWNLLAGIFAEKLKDDVIFTYDWFGSGASDIYAPGQRGTLGTYITPRELTQKSAYAEVYWQFFPRVTLTAGARYYDFSRTVQTKESGPLFGGISHLTDNGGAKGASPRVNLSYKPTDDALLYALYSEGFRLGTPQPGLPAPCGNAEGLVNGTNVPIASTKNVNSDKMKNYELGAKLSLLSRSLTIDGDVFHMIWSGVPVRVLAPAYPTGCGLSYVANAGTAQSDGVEFQANYRITSSWRADVGGSWVHARLANAVPAQGWVAGDRLPGSPEGTANLGLQYGFQMLGFTAFVRTDTVYVGDSYGNINESPILKSPSYVKIDAATGITIGKMNAELFVRNLTNQDAFVFRGTTISVPAFYGYRLRPRTAGLQVMYSF